MALKIGSLLKNKGYNPHFVSKGYGGMEKKPNPMTAIKLLKKDKNDE